MATSRTDLQAQAHQNAEVAWELLSAHLARLPRYEEADTMLNDTLVLMGQMGDIKGAMIGCRVDTTYGVHFGLLPPETLQYLSDWRQTLTDYLENNADTTMSRDIIPDFSTLQNLLESRGDHFITVQLAGQEGQTVGWLGVNPESWPLSASARKRLDLLAAGLSQTIANLQLRSSTNLRLRELKLLYNVALGISSNLDLAELLPEIMHLTAQVLQAEASSLMLVDQERAELVFSVIHGDKHNNLQEARIKIGDGIAGWVAQHGEPVVVNHASTDVRFDILIDKRSGFDTRSIVCVPLQARGKVIGVIEVLNKLNHETFDYADVALLTTLAAQAAIAIDNARLYNDLLQERNRILEAGEEVRRELARDLHDGPAQQLAAITMNIDFVKKLAQHDPAKLPAELDSLEKLAKQTNRDIRNLLFGLRPLVLETRGLVAALESYLEQQRNSEPPILHLEHDEPIYSLSVKAGAMIFGIVQEAVNNVRKHAHAENVWIKLSRKNNDLAVYIRDDGAGFDVRAVESTYDKRGSFGLLNMKERARLVGASLSINSIIQKGSTVTLSLPLDTNAEVSTAS